MTSLFSRIYDFVQMRKKVFACLLGLIVLVSLIGLRFIQYNNDIALMLPQDEKVQQTMRFLREANFSDKVVISLALNGEKHTAQDLVFAAEEWAASIKSPLIKSIISNVAGSDVMAEMFSFLKYTPQLLTPEALTGMAAPMTPDFLKKRMKFIQRQFLTPGSTFMGPFLRADPLGFSSGILGDIRNLSASSGYEVVIDQGHLLSKDGRHVMVILKTGVNLTEGFGSRELIAYLRQELKRLPGFVTAEIIAGHLHTISNEDVIKKDIGLTATMASFAFLLLFLLFFRDLKAGLVFLIPFVAVLISTTVAGLVFKNLSYAIIGMGTVIAGISIDYGIFVYIAVRKRGARQETILQIFNPIAFSALTTISVFSVFFFSSVKGYNQLAFFLGLSMVVSLILALFILPHFLNQEKESLPASIAPAAAKIFTPRANDRLWILIWAATMIGMGVLGTGLRFKNDITQFDGTAKDILAAEEEFHAIWGGKDLPAIFVVQAKSLEEAYQINSDVYEAASKKIGPEHFTSLASIWPGRETRQKNLLHWKKFWAREKGIEIGKSLIENGKAYGFSPDAFQPFFEQMHTAGEMAPEPEGLSFFDHLKEQFVVKNKGGYQIFSFFQDRSDYLEQLTEISRHEPGTFLVSRKNFSNIVSRAFGSEMIFLFLSALFSSAFLTVLLLRDMRLAALALVPVLTGLITTAGVMAIAGLALNMPSIIAAMVVVGIVSDYGMFAVYDCKHKLNTGTFQAITFAAGSTLIGAGVLLFARHPLLFSIGTTLVTGVLSGYLSSLVIIPPLYRLWLVEKS